jgi:hypothetical protein
MLASNPIVSGMIQIKMERMLRSKNPMAVFLLIDETWSDNLLINYIQKYL